ncbi:Uncharacterized protein HZ326_16012 [Fusarium oxysporum f. sp. albedinis]|nr:Chromatin-associated protein swi6 [Fusarium oxysporum f. sp. albedinis]KAJ0141105.1 Uncharacterized protein HZ326_16012 [Fusarium oxysporum f. sp. albedinis]
MPGYELPTTNNQHDNSTSLIQPTNRVYIWDSDLDNQHNNLFDLHLALRFDSQLGDFLIQPASCGLLWYYASTTSLELWLLKKGQQVRV